MFFITKARELARNTSIRTRVIAIALTPTSMTIVLFVFVVCAVNKREIKTEINSYGNHVSKTIAAGFQNQINQDNIATMQSTIASVIALDSNIYQIDILDANYNVIASKKLNRIYPEQAISFTQPIVARPASNTTSYEMEIGEGVVSENGTGPGELVLGFVNVILDPRYICEENRKKIQVRIFLITFSAIISVLCGLYFSRSLVKPLRDAIIKIAEIRNGDFGAKLEVSTGGELGELLTAINSASAAIKEARSGLEQKVLERTEELRLSADELKRSRDEIMQADDEKRRLIKRINAIVEENSRFVAAEIHDELNATLIASKLSAQRILRIIESEIEQNEKTEELKSLTRSLIDLQSTLYSSARNIVRHLRPEVLEVLGLSGALNDIIEKYNATSDETKFSLSVVGLSKKHYPIS